MDRRMSVNSNGQRFQECFSSSIHLLDVQQDVDTERELYAREYYNHR